MVRLRQTPELSAATGLPILLPVIDPQFLACPIWNTRKLVLFDFDLLDGDAVGISVAQIEEARHLCVCFVLPPAQEPAQPRRGQSKSHSLERSLARPPSQPVRPASARPPAVGLVVVPGERAARRRLAPQVAARHRPSQLPTPPPPGPDEAKRGVCAVARPTRSVLSAEFVAQNGHLNAGRASGPRHGTHLARGCAAGARRLVRCADGQAALCAGAMPACVMRSVVDMCVLVVLGPMPAARANAVRANAVRLRAGRVVRLCSVRLDRAAFARQRRRHRG